MCERESKSLHVYMSACMFINACELHICTCLYVCEREYKGWSMCV